MQYKRGDIVYANLPSSQKDQTHEQMGRRPVVILQDEDVYNGLPTVIIIPFTTTQETIRFFSTLLVEPSQENGLAQKSVLLSFQIMAIDRQRLDNKIGELENHYIEELEQKIKLLIKI